MSRQWQDASGAFINEDTSREWQDAYGSFLNDSATPVVLRSAQIPGGSFINESSAAQRQIPGTVFIVEAPKSTRRRVNII